MDAVISEISIEKSYDKLEMEALGEFGIYFHYRRVSQKVY